MLQGMQAPSLVVLKGLHEFGVSLGYRRDQSPPGIPPPGCLQT